MKVYKESSNDIPENIKNFLSQNPNFAVVDLSEVQNDHVHHLRSALDRLEVIGKLLEKDESFGGEKGPRYKELYAEAVKILVNECDKWEKMSLA